MIASLYGFIQAGIANCNFRNRSKNISLKVSRAILINFNDCVVTVLVLSILASTKIG